MYTRSTDYLGNSSRSDFNLKSGCKAAFLADQGKGQLHEAGNQRSGRSNLANRNNGNMKFIEIRFMLLESFIFLMESHSLKQVEQKCLRFSEVLGERGAVFPMEIYLKAKLIKFDTKNPVSPTQNSPGLPDGIAQV